MTNDVHPNELFQRYEGNPILKASDFPKMVNAVFNPAAVAIGGDTLLFVRVEPRSGLSHLAVATSRDGRTGWHVDPSRSLHPLQDTFAEHWGIEDPRITKIGDEYMIVYTGYSAGGPLVCLATTRDFRTYDRRGVLQSPEDKDAALFPTTIGGRYALIHRPVPTANLGAHMWISWSPDLRHWGDARVLLAARRGGWWDANKIGLGPPPLLTDEGWLVCYHGVKTTAAGSLYRLGLALLDRDHPNRVLSRGNEWVFGPHASYERQGDVPDVVFPCGWILREDGDSLDLYYGASDSSVCLATASLAELLDHVRTHESTPDDRFHNSFA
jgi:predicted GH43/DUF377 family glycosyl hydrolase